MVKIPDIAWETMLAKIWKICSFGYRVYNKNVAAQYPQRFNTIDDYYNAKFYWIN